LDRARAGVLARSAAAAELRTAAADHLARMAELEALLDAVNAGGGLLAALARRREEAERTCQGARREQERSEAALVAADRSLRVAEEERVEADVAVRRAATQLRLFSDAARSLHDRVDSSAAQVATLEAEAASAADARERSGAAAAAAEAARAAAEAAMANARRVVEETQAALESARQGARAALARSAALRGQVEGALGGRGAIAAAVAAGELEARRLVDCFSVVDPADGPAVEAALEAHLGAWIVDDLDAAAALLDTSSAREELLLRRAGGVPAPLPGPAGARTALSCLRAEPGIEATLAQCLAGTWLVDDPNGAPPVVAAGGRAVLPDGTVLTTSGLRGGGRPGRTLLLAAQEHEAAALAEQAMSFERRAEASRSAAATELAAAEAAERRSLEQLQRARVETAEAAARATAAGDALAAETARLEAARAELDARDRERDSLAGADSAAAARLGDAQVRLDEARAGAEAGRGVLADARTAASDAEEALRAVEVEAGRVAAEGAERSLRIEAARRGAETATARCTANEMRVLTVELEVLGAIAHGRAAATARGAATAAVAAALEALSATSPDLAQSERAVAALEAERAEVAVVLARAEDERAAAGQEVAAASARVAELAEVVRDDEEDEAPEPQAGDADRAEREIVRLERRVAAMGPVNALAPEQHQQLAARVAILRAGRDDLGSACADIRAMAARLISAVDSRFEAVFGAVSLHFHELFSELFPGGRATLRREEPDLLQVEDNLGRSSPHVGVEILAQPPGKRLQPLSLLSGGERALTALAVILALQQVNPSPFYVFDEVDAPLDDSNVLRFTRLLRRLAAAQQFIVVTHNHITMAAADALHGVTSDSDGVSSVISVRFDAQSGETVAESNVVGLRQSTIRAAM
ncbi:MAG: hypothetical protein ACRENL_02495, partial [Candidatus Dormibacteria bacterium]